MSDTREQILQGARQCFFQHGYQKTTMTLVSDYAEFSRVTVHKHFKNKEDLFVAVLEQEMTAKFEKAMSKVVEGAPAWENIEAYVVSIASTIFENIKDEHILKDLDHAFNHVGAETKVWTKKTIIDFIANQLELGEGNNELSLDQSKMTYQQMAELIDACFAGVFLNTPLEQIENQIRNLIRIFKLSTNL